MLAKLPEIPIIQARRGVAQPGRVLAWGARGRKFESCHPDQKFQKCRFTAFYFGISKLGGQDVREQGAAHNPAANN